LLSLLLAPNPWFLNIIPTNALWVEALNSPGLGNFQEKQGLLPVING
jgi:hypothetical protein